MVNFLIPTFIWTYCKDAIVKNIPLVTLVAFLNSSDISLSENEYIINLRKHYITKIIQYKKDGRIIIYFDESYVNW